MDYFIKSGPILKDRYRIGFLDDNQNNEFHNQILAGIIDAASEHNIEVISFNYYSSNIAKQYSRQVDMVLDHIRQYKLDGLIFIGWTQAGAMYNYDGFMNRFSRMPLLSIGTNYHDIPSVVFAGDDFIRKMVYHLINDHNYKRIAYIEHHRPDSRTEAYIHAMEQFDIYDPMLYVSDKDLPETDFAQRNKRAVEILLDERKTDVEAIILLNINETSHLINALKDRGISVPGDIAVTSYEDGDYAKYSVPGFTTVYFPWKELGKNACINMATLLREGRIPHETSVSGYGRIIYRDSCGCLPYYVKSADVSHIKPAAHTLSNITDVETRGIIDALDRLYSGSGMQIKALIDAFLLSCKNRSNTVFLSELNKQLLNINENAGIEELVSDIKKQFMPYLLNDIKTMLWSGDLFLQSLVLANEKAACLHGSKVLEAKMINRYLQIVNQNLLFNYSLQNLTDSLARGLPGLNIGSCHIFVSNSIYTGSDSNEDLFDNSVLIFKYDNAMKQDISGAAGSLKQQLSEILRNGRDNVTLAHLLHIGDEFIGFALFGLGPLDEAVYQSLATHISTALMGIVLLNRLNATYKKLIERAQREGMADIAADILHNIGNILNSINVSVHLMEEAANSSVAEDIMLAGRLLNENLHRIEDFITQDVKGKKLMQFYLKLGHAASRLQNQLQYNLDRLKTKIGAINAAITAQQSYTGAGKGLERLNIVPILEDALKLNQDSFDKSRITVIRDYTSDFTSNINRAGLFFVIVNIISNAKEAMGETSVTERKLTVSINKDTTGKYIKFSDTGMGIAEERLNRLFDYGFTTKPGRPGFGLYSCAAYMADMGGSAQALSDGDGKGASFVLRFPLE